MDAKEYLLNHLAEEYRPHRGTVVVLTTKDAYIPFMLNGRIYCTGKMDIDNQWYAFIADETVDGCILHGLPRSLFIRTKYRAVNAIAEWINNNIFRFMLEHSEVQQSKTELVRLRIAVNMISTAPYLDKDSKILWSNWVKELYWERKKVLHQWYLENILPF